MKSYLHTRQQALDSFANGERIQSCWRALTQATDTLLAKVADTQLTLVATGGYGRCELFPYSDVDILVLVDDTQAAGQVQHIIDVLQQLWDMHIPVSHATRSVEQTIREAQTDHTIATGLMDARLVCGDRAQFLRLKKGLKHDVFGRDARQFVEAKLRERDARHSKWGDSRFVLEPHIKDGKGGLRDLQTLSWLARYCYGLQRASQLVREDLLQRDEWQHYRHAYEFFSTVRGHLHQLRGRADERLTFDAQLRIAETMKFPGRGAQAKAEALMLRYFQFTRQVGNLTRIFCAILEEENLRIPQAPFAAFSEILPGYLTLTNGRLNYAESADITAVPHQLIGLFAVSQQHGLAIHPRAQLALSRALPYCSHHLPTDPESNRLFLHMLLSKNAADLTLRTMNTMGVLGALIPEFGRIGGQMQYDGYHTYTVDEHTLVAVANLATIESGEWIAHLPLSTALARDITDRAPLYVAMLCHDIAKGLGGGHAEKGEILVQRIAARLGLSAAQGDLAAWLVKYHSLITEIAFKRDLDDEKTIEDFVATVQSPERLKLLTILTTADIMAVGPERWNHWKSGLLAELYHKSAAAMSDVKAPHADVLPDNDNVEAGKTVIHISQRPKQDHTEVTVTTPDRPGLFSMLSGALAASGASIVAARIFTLSNGMAQDVFQIQSLHGHAYENVPFLTKTIKAVLDGKLDLAAEIRDRQKTAPKKSALFMHPPRVIIDNDASVSNTVVEVNGSDRPGFLYAITSALTAQGLQISAAKVTTFGSRAVDVFYIRDNFGLKIVHPDKLKMIESSLKLALEQGF